MKPWFASLILFLLAPVALAASVDAPVTDTVGAALSYTSGTGYIRVLVLTTLIALIPVLLVSVTAFTRIVIVLSAVRMGLGMQETPSSTVIITLALCLTMFAMAPTGREINTTALQPYLHDGIDAGQFVDKAIVPLKAFMLAHVRDSDLALVEELAAQQGDAAAAPPADYRIAEVPIWHLMPAFMLSELKTAFQMAFMVLLPFLLIDLLVSVGLMSLGMMMVPPTTISLPLKILMFVLVDGWAVIARSLVSGVIHGGG